MSQNSAAEEQDARKQERTSGTIWQGETFTWNQERTAVYIMHLSSTRIVENIDSGKVFETQEN